jgi:hypothetical protein
MSDDTRRSEWDPPPGHYAMHLTSAKLQLSFEDDKPYLAVVFWIFESADLHWLDREWRKRMYLTPKAEKHTKIDLRRMGASPRALSDYSLLVGERIAFECDVVYAGRFANLKNITTRIELNPVPPTGAPEPEETFDPEPGTPVSHDW